MFKTTCTYHEAYDDGSFDIYGSETLIMHINTVFTILNEMGVGPADGFVIDDASANWDDYITDRRKFDKIKTYMYLKVRMYFDPPQNSSHAEAIKQQISELEWRLNVSAENTTE